MLSKSVASPGFDLRSPSVDDEQLQEAQHTSLDDENTEDKDNTKKEA